MGKLKERIEPLIAEIQGLRELLKSVDDVDDEDELWLSKLFTKKIWHFLVMELLLRSGRKQFAFELLKQRYLGAEIDLACNIRDHVADLDVFFDDIVEILGERELAALVSDPAVSRENLQNDRVKDAVRAALSLENAPPDELPTWYPANR